MENVKDIVKAFFEPVLNAAIKNSNDEEEKKDEVKNEDVDKRKLIDEVAGIMKSAGCDDEVIRTAIGKMEKIGYDKSEAGTADNKKVKNEDKKEDEDVKNKKVKNEDEEDEEKVEDLKEDVKEDIKNKCKNSVENDKTDYYTKLNEIYNSTAEYKPQNEYVSRADREKAAEEYFKN
jgi:hypothetical protein